VVEVAAGWMYSALTAEGKLFSLGWGEYGQLGLGNRHERLTPTCVGAKEAFDGSRVLMVVVATMTLWP
jgi:alpha-tubulin suppressor-like RCC1 family protein